MHYRADESTIRDAREDVADAEREIKIADLEKQKEYYEDINDAIDDQIDKLNELIDKSNDYYDSQIEAMEKYYDSLIESLENQKSKWEELADIKEVAEAYSAIQQVFGDLGYTVEDVLSGNEAAFEAFKNDYIALMSDMGQNTSFQDGLAYATGVAKENFGSLLDSTNEVAGGLDTLGEKTASVDGIATSMDNASTSASNLSTSTQGVSEDINGISDSLNKMPSGEVINGITKAFEGLADALNEIATALGVGEDGTVGGLVQSLKDLGDISLGDENTGLVAQFNNLASAVGAVSSAINGTGGTSGDPQDSSSPSMSAGANGGGSITSALDELKSKADTVLGSGGSSGENGTAQAGSEESSGEGVIGQFDTLKDSVDSVSEAIGGGETENGGNGESEADTSSLSGAITALGQTTNEVMSGGEGEDTGVIGKFEEFKGVVEETKDFFSEMLTSLETLSSQEWEIKVTVTGNGAALFESNMSFIGGGTGVVPNYRGTVGNAYAEGYPGLPQAESNALRSEFGQPELTVYPDGRYELTTEPTISSLPKDTVIFNERQTKKILGNKGKTIGKAFADGTDPLFNGRFSPINDEKFEKFQNLVLENTDALMQNNTLLQQKYNDITSSVKGVSASTINKQQAVNFSMGDIVVQGVQDVDGFANAVKTHFPNAMLQAMFKK